MGECDLLGWVCWLASASGVRRVSRLGKSEMAVSMIGGTLARQEPSKQNTPGQLVSS